MDCYTIAKPYSSHPIAVADMMTTDEEKILAYLHDIPEDCDGWGISRKADDSSFKLITTKPYREEFEINYNIYYGLNLITKDENLTYIENLKNIITNQFRPGQINFAPNKLARNVKTCDMFHNISDNCSDSMKKRYYKGIKYLISTL